MLQNIYSVSEFTASVQRLLESSFSSLLIQGEISGLSRPSSGHLYFRLKDKHSQISCAFFRASAVRLPFKLEEGLEIIVRGKIAVYAPQGNYQIIVSSAEPIGHGAFQLAFEQLKSKLEKEGLFEQSKKRQIPFLPQKIGLVTSPTGAVLQDILTTLGRRFPRFHLVLAPTSVQGKEAPREIIRALQNLERESPEVIILARGGGPPEDLQAFNDEKIARAIVQCKIPVISAIGHETDYSIADLVADLRAPTPSAAAELVLPSQVVLQQNLEGLNRRLFRSWQEFRQKKRIKLEWTSQTLRSPKIAILGHIQHADELKNRVMSAWNHFIRKQQHQHENLKILLEKNQPSSTLQNYKHQQASLQKSLILRSERILLEQTQKLELYLERLNSLNPLVILKQGYAQATIGKNKEKKVIASINDVDLGDSLHLQISDGIIETQIKKIDKRTLNSSLPKMKKKPKQGGKPELL